MADVRRCCIIASYILLLLKGENKKPRRSRESPPLIRLVYYMEVLKEKKAEAGEPAEGLRIRQKIIQKSIKKVLTKARMFDIMDSR